MSPTPVTPTPKPKLKFGEPEKPNVRMLIAKGAFIGIALILIIWMIAKNSQQHEMSCRTTGQTSLIGFGTCE